MSYPFSVRVTDEVEGNSLGDEHEEPNEGSIGSHHFPAPSARNLAKAGAAHRRETARRLGAEPPPEHDRPIGLPIAPAYSTARTRPEPERKRKSPDASDVDSQQSSAAESPTDETPRETVLGLVSALLLDVANGDADEESTLRALDLLGRYVERSAKPRTVVKLPREVERREALTRLGVDERAYVVQVEEERDAAKAEVANLRARLRAAKGRKA